jgi:hypothetical protein
MIRVAVVAFLAASCTAAMQPPRAGLCSGPVSCGREQLLEADEALQHAVQQRGAVAAFSDAFLPDGKLLADGRNGPIEGGDRIAAAVAQLAPSSWVTARGDVSAGAELGYTFGWTRTGERLGHYAAVWKRQNGEWKLAVYLHKPARPQDAPPPDWFAPFRGEREASRSARQTVAAADTEFAALAKQTGSTQEAFTAYAAQDAVQLGSSMVFGRDAIHDLLARAPLIDWSPIAAGAAGDLGYTVGAYHHGSTRGSYLTIWRLESDGSWRFVLDGGVTG